jgi:cyclophilin family peptidyl-prolyl cis-trans isomerase
MVQLNSSCLKSAGVLLAAAACFGQELRFTPTDALKAEWARQAPALVGQDLPAEDRARLDLTLRRIGAPGAPPLLPPELEQPTAEAWVAKARAARTPEERFTALFFLNRLKSPLAFSALEGLAAADAENWPRHLHLENAVATARINGSPAEAGVRAFLDGLAVAGKVEPIRLQAAQLRLNLAGVEKVLLDPLDATPQAVLAMMEAWNRTPLEQRERHPKYRDFLASPLKNLDVIGLKATPATDPAVHSQPFGAVLPSYTAFELLMARWIEGLPDPAPAEAWPLLRTVLGSLDDVAPSWRWAALQALPRFRGPGATGLARQLAKHKDPRVLWQLLPGLRKLDPAAADALRDRLLFGKQAVARGIAIEDLARLPAKLKELVKLVAQDGELDGLQALLQALDRWNLPPEPRKALLLPFLQNPDWSKRYEAWKALVKLDPQTPWPTTPAADTADLAILEVAEQLLLAASPVRIQLTFNGGRRVVLHLDPAVAPMNVANLKLLVQKGHLNGRLVPRVVPDFVVQMGSPYDTMDGGPGYSVRCENSLDFYTPGSVGMALSGKDTGGCQFFITLNATPHLTGRYTRLGEVEHPDAALPLLDQLELGARIEKAELLGEQAPKPVAKVNKPKPKQPVKRKRR